MIQSSQQKLGQRDIFCDNKKVKSKLCYNIHEHYVINNIESKYLWQNFLKKKEIDRSGFENSSLSKNRLKLVEL